MPQGRKVSRLPVPEATTYERKREVDTSGPRKMPKSAKAAANVNMGFIKALGVMTRNAEQIAAGKLVRTGKVLTMPDLQQQAGRQLEIDRKAGEKAVFDPEARNHVKGMRGNFDLDELGELVPALRTKLDDVRRQRTEAQRAAKAAVASMAGLISGAGVPAPSKEGGADGGSGEPADDAVFGARLAGGKRRRGDTGPLLDAAAAGGGSSAAMVRALAGALGGGRGGAGEDGFDPAVGEEEGDQEAGEEAKVAAEAATSAADAEAAPGKEPAAASVHKMRQPRRRSSAGPAAPGEASAAGTAAAALRAAGAGVGVSAPQSSLRPLFEPLSSAAAAAGGPAAAGQAPPQPKQPQQRARPAAAKPKAAPPAVAATRAALFAQLCELGGDDDA